MSQSHFDYRVVGKVNQIWNSWHYFSTFVAPFSCKRKCLCCWTDPAWPQMLWFHSLHTWCYFPIQNWTRHFIWGWIQELCCIRKQPWIVKISVCTSCCLQMLLCLTIPSIHTGLKQTKRQENNLLSFWQGIRDKGEATVESHCVFWIVIDL